MSDVLPPIDELLAEFDSGKVPRSQVWHTLITGLYFNFDNVNEIENWYNTVLELTSINQQLANDIKLQHDQVEIWYGQIDTWQQQVSQNTTLSEQYKDHAQASATAASHSESAAAQSATSATDQATAAAGSANSAKISETSAAGSASDASDSAILAKQSETAAERSAGQAASSASSSENSANAAAQSATKAGNSATAAGVKAEEAAEEAAFSQQSSTEAKSQADRAESEADRSEVAADRAVNASSRFVGELIRVSLDTPPPGCFALDGSRVVNGKNDFAALANSGSRFITVSGNDLILADQPDFGRGKGSSGRNVGGFESFQSTPYDNKTIVSNSQGTFINGPLNGWHSANTVDTARFTRYKVNQTYRSEFETRPSSITELVCIYHGVI